MRGLTFLFETESQIMLGGNCDYNTQLKVNESMVNSPD